MHYRKEVDGLRALAVLPVIFYHAGLKAFSGGFVGVDVFFVISGYLITSLLLASSENGKFTFLGFYERRARRILPALFLVTAVCIPFAWALLLPTELEGFSKSLIAVTLFASNILFWRERNYFDADSELKPLLHTWSLSVEEQFYVLFPVILAFALRWPRRWVALSLVILGTMSLALAQWGAFVKPAATFFLLPTRAWELSIGAVLAFFNRGAVWQSNKASFNIPHVACQCAAGAGLALISFAVFTFDRNTPFPSLYALLPTGGAALILVFAAPNTFVGRILSTRVLVGVGLISYSAYLWHWPIFVFARESGLAMSGDAVTLLLVAGAFLLAFLSWRYVEMPFRRVGGVSKSNLVVSAALGSLLFIVIGVVGYVSKGFLNRYEEADRYMLNQHQIGPEYVTKLFNHRKLVAFDETDKKRLKVLIIGDSYAQDLVNVIAEAGMLDHIQISSHYIASRCGNLYLKEDLDNLIPAEFRSRCKLFEWNGDWYRSQVLRNLLLQADMVWLVSNWTYKQAELLPKSVSNIEKDFGVKVIVFGSKDFSAVRMRALLDIPETDRAAFRIRLGDDHVKVNRLMQSNLRDARFIDISAQLCGSDMTCPLFTKDGKLLSFDGGHLTRDGAKLLGERLNGLRLLDGMRATE